MSLLARVGASIEQQIGVIAVTPLVLLVTWVATAFGDAMYPVITEILPPKAILPMLLLSLILNIALVALLYWYRRKYTIKLAFGVYWDRKLEAHCPHCKGPMTFSQPRMNGPIGYHCETCKIVRLLKNNRGELRALEDVAIELKRKRKPYTL